MADQAEPEQGSAPMLNLKIYTQQPAPDDTLNLHLPSNNTVAQLKEKIKDAITSHPTVDRLRLIYRGHALLSPNLTLLTVLGEEAAQQAETTHVFHLVISADSASAQRHVPNANTQRHQPPVPNVPPNLANTAGQPQPHQHGGMPNWPGFQVPQHHFHHGNPQPFPGPFVPVPPPFMNQHPGMPNHFAQNHIAFPPQAMQPHGPPSVNATGVDGVRQHLDGVRRHLQQTMAGMPPGPMRDALQQQLAMVEHQAQHLQNQSAGTETAHQLPGEQSQEQEGQLPEIPEPILPRESSSEAAQAQPAVLGVEPSVEAPSNNVSTREASANDQLDGGNDRPAIAESLAALAPVTIRVPAAFSNGRQASERRRLANDMPNDYLFQQAPAAVENIRERCAQSAAENSRRLGLVAFSASRVDVQEIDVQMFLLERACAKAFSFYGSAQNQPWRRRAGSLAVQLLRSLVLNRNSAQSIINSSVERGPPTRLAGSRWDSRDLEDLRQRSRDFQEMVSRTQNLISRWQRGDIIAPPERIPDPEPRTQLEQPLTYLQDVGHDLATNVVNTPVPSLPTPSLQRTSQQNPETISAYLLNSPSGPYAVVYSSQGTFTSIPVQQQAAFAPQQGPVAFGNNVHEQARRLLQARQLGLQPGQPPQPGQQQQGGEGDFFGPLQPMFRAVWLLVRILGFVWLFTAGNFSSRSVLILVGSLLFWAFQAGIFGDHAVRLRRYWEGLLGLEGEGDAQQAQNQGRGGEAAGAANAQARNGDAIAERRDRNAPSPQQALERIQREREEQNRGWLRERVRGVERTAALFLASLWPGLGERHVRQQERVRRDAEEQHRREAAAETEEENRRQATVDAAAEELGRRVEEDVASRNTAAQSAEETNRSEEANKAAPTLDGEGTSSGVALHNEQEGSSQVTRRREGDGEDDS